MSVQTTLTFKELKQQPLEDIFESVLRYQQILTVQLTNGLEVLIQPKLKPLPTLDGYVSKGWKEAIYMV
ncbi:hypothetical protein PN36_06990 [Candidatus Thiomargarita nelsonii]|uniref:Uncharacterized protein n=1 Tax=Candidatus Thiomargarita nelsonii TaxID=1003181 RepID=A0A0A6PJM6_9GAMM|nr:hypothetical protein PN36_06990 [Candidatus Thiomargarita nelsonii]